MNTNVSFVNNDLFSSSLELSSAFTMCCSGQEFSVVLKEAGHVLLSWVVYTVLNLQALESGHMDSHTCSQAGAIRSASECISIKKH